MRASLITVVFMSAAAAMAQPPSRAEQTRSLFGMTEAEFEKQLAARFQYPPPSPRPAVADDPAEGQALDAAYFQSFPDHDRAYSPAARKRAKELAAALARDARLIRHEQFVMRVAQIAALADNAHTAVGENALRKGTPRIPVRTFLFDDGLHVLRAAPVHADLLGARIETIAGLRVDALYQRLGRYLGGVETRRRLRLLPVLESPALLQAAGVATPPDRLLVAGKLADGRPFERWIDAEQRDGAAPVSNTIRQLFPSVPGEPMASFLRLDSATPVYLRNSRKLFSVEPLPDGGLYFALSHNTDGDVEPIAPFLAEALLRLKGDRPAFVVLDMRMNGGGDYTTTYDFARALPVAAGGNPIYVLTSPWTFSAAITTVAALKDAGGRQVAIVGEPVGDRLDFWAEGGTYVLPNSGIQVSYSAGRHNYAGPCTDRGACFWLNELYPVRVSDLDPDIPAPITFAAYRAGRDPAMEAVLRRQASGR